MVSEALVAAYRATDYVVDHGDGALVLNVGVHNADMDRLFQASGTGTAAFITAENPRSETLDAATNARRQAQLREDLLALDGVMLVTGCGQGQGQGQGQDGRWPAEASFLALGIEREAAMILGRSYQQNALLWVEQGAAAELLFPLDN